MRAPGLGEQAGADQDLIGSLAERDRRSTGLARLKACLRGGLAPK